MFCLLLKHQPSTELNYCMAPEKVSINNLIFEYDIYSHTQHTQNKPEYVRVTKGRTWEMSDSVCPGVALAELPKAACIV